MIGGTPVTMGTWTFGNDPENDTIDAIRILIGDVDEDYPIIEDASLEYFYSITSNVLLASAKAATAIAGLYTRKVSKKIGDRSINYSDLAKQYRELANDLRSEYKRTVSFKFTMPTITKTHDSQNYPRVFEHTDVSSVTWDDET